MVDAKRQAVERGDYDGFDPRHLVGRVMTRGPRDLMDFAGHWLLAREIEDRNGDRRGTLEGVARLSKEGGRLVYDEEGVLSFPGQPDLTAARRYFWDRSGNGGVAVAFDDERAFHEFSLSRTMPEATHHCAPDMYHVTYDFTLWPRWSSAWTVHGPRKDYRMVSRYRRQI